MNDNLISEIIDLNKVKMNLLELQKMWEQLITTMAAKSSKDLKFDDLAQNLKTVTTAEAELAKTKQASFEVDKQKVKITAEIIANYDKYGEEERKIIENEIKRKHEISETNKLLKDRFTNEQDLVKILQRETKSIADLDKQNKDLQRIQQKLNLTTKEGLDANAKINAQIEKNKETIKEHTNVIDKQRRNIGNYQEAVDTANMSLGEMRKELRELRNMSFAGLNPEEIKQVRDRMAELTDEIGDFQAQINTAAADKIPALMDGLRGLIAVAQGVTGTLAMFGVETEKLDKAMVQLIGVSQALKTAQELHEKGTIKVMLATIKDTAAKTANAVAAKGQAMATNGATMAIRALGRVMKSNPYGVIAAAAAAAVTAIVSLVKVFKKQTSEMREQAKMFKELKGIKDNYTAGLEVERQTMNNLFEDIKKTNAGTEERKILVDELNRKYKDYLPDLDLEKATIQELVIAQKASNVELQNKIAIQAQDKAMSEIITNMTDLKIKEMEVTKELEMAEWQRIEAMKAGEDVPLFYAAQDELDAIRDSLQAYEQQLKNIQEYFRGQITATQQSTTATQTNTSTTNTANDAYKSYLETITKANEEAKLQLALGENATEVRKRELEAIYAATKAYYELNGYTKDEIEKLKKLRAEIDKLNAEIEEEKGYQTYLEAIKKSNEEAKLQIALGENAIEVRAKELEAIYSATKARAELNGYTEDEIEKLKELRAEIEKLNAEIEEEKGYQTYLDAIKKANEEAKLQIALGEDATEVRKRELEAIYAATKAYFELNGYTADEIKKLEELRAEIDKLDAKIEEETVGIIAKLKKVFDDFFDVKPIENWKDAFKESITAVLNESFELYNQIIDMQSNQLEQELEAINIMYDKQVSTLDSAYEKRKSLLEATIDDEEELAAALARIEEEKTATYNKMQDEKIAKEQEVAKKRAILEKKRVAMEVAAGSASALVEAIKLLGIATATAAPGDPYTVAARIAAALAAALTVVSAVTAGIAKVKAIQIPEFWAGGEAEEGQLISVAERGRELAVGESGQAYMFDKRTVFIAPEKMRIFSNKETNKIMEKQTINNVYEKSNNVNLTIAIDNERHKKYFKLN